VWRRGTVDADDVLQEVPVLLYRKLASLHAPELFRAWAFRIASRAGFRHIKQRQRQMEPLDEYESGRAWRRPY
jgi:DNA-directed RNA polymerase specialized sigma24 family protein